MRETTNAYETGRIAVRGAGRRASRGRRIARAPRAFLLSAAAALAVTVLPAGCATAGRPEAVPAWVLETPRADSSSTWFVGQSSLGGPLGDAMDDAAANLVASVVQYLGVTVSVETDARARATLDAYRAEIAQTVRTEATGRLAGFQVRSRYVDLDRKTGRRTVYLLASYATADLEREKARIAALFRERDDAVSRPEAEAKSFALAGRAQDAVLSRIQAAMAASGAGVDNADAKQSRNLAAARALASGMRLVAEAGEARVNAGEAFPRPFVIRLLADDGAGGSTGVAGARLLVSYARRQGSRLATKTVQAVTDGRGLLSFTPPPPDFVGQARLQVRLDCQDALDLLGGLPTSRAAEAAAVESALRAIAVEVPYESLSRARAVPIAVAMAGGDGQEALAAALSRAGFDLRPAGFALEGAAAAGASGSGGTAAQDGAAILDMARRAASVSGYSRLAYGQAAAVGSRQDGTAWVAEARASASVVDLATGALLFSGERVSQAPGADDGAARRAAIAEACTALAQDLLASLP